jgi:hypothetical protein
MPQKWAGKGPQESPDPSDYDSDGVAVVKRLVARPDPTQPSSSSRAAFNANGDPVQLSQLTLSDIIWSQVQRPTSPQWLTMSKRSVSRLPPGLDVSEVVQSLNQFSLLDEGAPHALPASSPGPSKSDSIPDLTKDDSDSEDSSRIP